MIVINKKEEFIYDYKDLDIKRLEVYKTSDFKATLINDWIILIQKNMKAQMPYDIEFMFNLFPNLIYFIKYVSQDQDFVNILKPRIDMLIDRVKTQYIDKNILDILKFSKAYYIPFMTFKKESILSNLCSYDIHLRFFIRFNLLFEINFEYVDDKIEIKVMNLGGYTPLNICRFLYSNKISPKTISMDGDFIFTVEGMNKICKLLKIIIKLMGPYVPYNTTFK